MASKPISVELKAPQRAILERQLKSGHYESINEVIGDALRALGPVDIHCIQIMAAARWTKPVKFAVRLS
jgi:hypothetical protein